MIRRSGAFTLTELIVVLALVAALGLLAIPALSASKLSSGAIVCQNNLRQLAQGWILYSAANNDRICTTATYDSGSAPSWVQGNMSVYSDAANFALIRSGLLYPYVNDVKLYKCPCDYRTINFPRLTEALTVRSYSMNAWMNPTSPYEATLKSFRKQSDISSPSKFFVMIEESPNIITDGVFLVDPLKTNYWCDVPAIYHDFGAGVSFADGHCQIKVWTDPVLIRSGTGISSVAFSSWAPQDPEAKDLHWLWNCATYVNQ